MNKPRAIGTWTETAVTRVLLRNGFPRAERSALHGAKDQGDITGTPVCWEVKGGKAAEQASDGQVLAWMAELDTECVHKGADVGVLVLKRKGVGAANADRWWAVMWLHDLAETAGREGITFAVPDGVPVRMTLADACRVLRVLGYGGAA
jgi:hypothetical protein